MSLSAFLQRWRGPSGARAGAQPTASTPADVEAARTLARRRLIGMLVLVGVGMVVFPTFLETQPRPVAADVHMSLATAPSAPTTVVAPVAVPRPVVVEVAPAAVVSEDATDEVPAPAVIASPVPESASSPSPVAPAMATGTAAPAVQPQPAEHKPQPKPKPEPKPDPKPQTPPKPVKKPEPQSESRPEPKSKIAADTRATTNERFVVQFGAFADPQAAREARLKLERMGIQTYAQQVDTPQGKRTRVRVGPFTKRADADKALAALRKAGLDGRVLTL